jgi:hypothetical protein
MYTDISDVDGIRGLISTANLFQQSLVLHNIDKLMLYCITDGVQRMRQFLISLMHKRLSNLRDLFALEECVMNVEELLKMQPQLSQKCSA